MEPEQEQQFKGITKLKFTGSGKYTIDDRGLIVCEKGTKAEQRGSKLIIGGHGGGVVIDNMFVSGGGSVSMSGGSISISSGGRSVVMVGNKTYINGKLVNPTPVEEHEDEAKEPIYRLVGNTKISAIRYDGSINVVVAKEWLDPSGIECHICGSSTLQLPNIHLDRAILHVSGSGSVIGNDTVAASCTAFVSGRGEVSRIHVSQDATLSVGGSSRISVTKSDAAKIVKNVTGSGKIKIK
jgi:hypothetical protein